MKVSNQTVEIVATTEITAQVAIQNTTNSQQTDLAPDYTEMMIEIQKIGDPVSFESLKDFYNIE